MPHAAEALTVERVQSCSTIVQQKIGLFKRQSVLFIMCWKESRSMMGDICFKMDQAAGIANSAFAPRTRERNGPGWDLGSAASGPCRAGCQVQPVGKSSLPYNQPAPRAGSRSSRFSL